MDYIGFVYLWRNLVNGKMYVGLHVGKVDDGYIGSGILFNKAIKKYGIENFEREILHFEHISVENLYAKEFEIINGLNAVKSEMFYNLTNGDPKYLRFVNGELTRIFTKEHKSNIAKARLGAKDSEETKAKKSQRSGTKGKMYFNDGIKEGRFLPGEEPKDWILGRIKSSTPNTKGMKFFNNGARETLFHPEDVPSGWILGRLSKNVKCGESNPFYGKKHSETSKEKMRVARCDVSGEKNPFFGKQHSEETKMKMRGPRH